MWFHCTSFQNIFLFKPYQSFIQGDFLGDMKSYGLSVVYECCISSDLL
jgi:hypothetical protein